MSSGCHCRFCSAELAHTFVDLGMTPLCESFIDSSQRNMMEPFYPLHVYVCSGCFLVQLEEYVSPESIFTEYAYFSSYSDSWLKHAEDYVDMAISRFALGQQSQVIELASNDGYLLQYFVERRVPALGIEPARNVAQVGIEKGVPTRIEFFGEECARALVSENFKADLLLGNNVLAQVPDLNDFVRGMKILLSEKGVITMEFPHLVKLMDGNQFDTIYHEHFSYFSFITVEKIFASHGLKIFDVEQITTHGGSLRIYACHEEDVFKPIMSTVTALRYEEESYGLRKMETYDNFAEQVKETKRALLDFLIMAKRKGRTIAGYGAPGKGNTLLNYCGIRTDFLDYTVDRNPYKQGKFLPGTHIPIFSPEHVLKTRPDYLMILPWNFQDEIVAQMAEIRSWGGKFVVPIPEVTILE